MPRDTRTISIFLASPGDVAREREVIAQTIDEWNQIRGRDRSTHFELLRWERSVSAGFAEDGQQVVTQQIGDNFDALIGVFWTRIGTATPRAESGTVEEYERALARRGNGENVEVAFFFKDAPVSLKALDLGQAQAVQGFKKRLESDGGLYKEFTDETVLRFEVNLLLDRLARDFGRNGEHESSGQQPAPADSPPLTSNVDRSDELGFLDVSESLENHSAKAQSFLSEMVAQLDQMTSTNQVVTSEMEELAKLGNSGPAVMRPLIARVTEGMNTFSEFMERTLPEYSFHSRGIADDTRALIDLSRDFETPDADIKQMEQNLVELMTAMDENYVSIEGVLDSTEGLQRMTVAFNHARRRLATNLRAYLEDLRSTRDVVATALQELRGLPQQR